MIDPDEDEIFHAMARCDRAIGKFVGKKRLNADVDELSRATLNLLCTIRVINNSDKMSRGVL